MQIESFVQATPPSPNGNLSHVPRRDGVRRFHERISIARSTNSGTKCGSPNTETKLYGLALYPLG